MSVWRHFRGTIAIIIIIQLLFMAGCQKDESDHMKSAVKGSVPTTTDAEPDNPVSFGYKCSWLAIRSEDADAVVGAIGLKDVRKCGWKEGIDSAYRDRVFVAPAINGWVLVVGFSLPEVVAAGKLDQLSELLQELGRKFSDVQYFGTHRVVGYQAWARAVNGKITRCYAFLGESGETLRNEGRPTDEETKLGLVFDESNFPDESDVMNLAGAWSINPTTLEEMQVEKRVGHLGSLPRRK